MECRACGRALEPDARFCPACGTAVVAACATCGAVLAADARFCSACGTPTEAAVVAPPAMPARERKSATMLFADLVGSTAFAERHDPEIVSSLVGGLFEHIGEEIRRYEGTIEKFAGDAVLAVFGVPVIHEDDPERAVRAALEMQAAVARLGSDAPDELRPRLRIGIETGEVLVDLDRASSARDLFVTGDAVNTAARLQTLAEAGTVVVGPTTYAATHGVIEYEELPPATLKGKAEPVAAWRTVSVKARRGGLRSPLGIEAPLIGRGDELDRLKETVRRAATSGRPELITVVGAPGVGKSRLIWELEKYLDGLPEPYHWRKGRCLAYAQASYAALADAIKADVGAADDDPPATVIEKLDGRLGALGGELGPDTRAALLATLGLEGETMARDVLVEGWTRYLGRIATLAPLVLVVEDIHWADEGLLDFIEYLARWGEGAIAILCLARHELFDRRPAWGGGIPNAATIVLEPLSAGETDELVEGLLAGGLPAALRERVVGLAEGNPLFAEELVRMFVDRGVLRLADGSWELARPVEEIEVPSSVQSVLAARLDGLPGDEKRLAQTAAVVGRVFWDILVAHLGRLGPGPTGDLLRRLRVKELVVPRQPSSLAGAAEFGFRHVLIRDVAYDSLPKRDRASLHVDVAGWAEETLADRIDEFAELIAAHFAAALAYEEELTTTTDADALRDLRVLLFTAAVRAARRAASVSALPAAQRWQQVAIDQAKRLDLPPRERIALALDFYIYLWHESEPAVRVAIFTEGVQLFDALAEPTDDDREMRARLQAARAEALFEIDELETAQSSLRGAIDALESALPSRGRAELRRVLGWTLWRTGHASEAESILELAVADARASASDAALRWALHDLGLARRLVYHDDKAIELLDASFELAQRDGDRALLARCYINIPLNRSERGDLPSEFRPLEEEGLQVARRDGAVMTITWIALAMAYEMIDEGRFADAVAYGTEAVDAARRAGDDDRLAAAHEALIWAYLERGERELAMREYDVWRALARRSESVGWAAMTGAAIGWMDDPRDAYRGLLRTFETMSPESESYGSVGRMVARTALRLDDHDGLSRGTAAYLDATSGGTGPIAILRRRAVEGLTEGDGSMIEAAAEELEAVGYRENAVIAFSDAALMAARAGRVSAAEERATTIAAEIGFHSWLGPLPETRWVAVQPTARAEG